MEIFLRDQNQALVEAWQDVFSDCSNVHISCGPIFDVTADAIISPANSFGFMDGGIDQVYLDHFGKALQDKLQDKIKSSYDGELPVGCAEPVLTDRHDIKVLLSCPTMRVPEDVSLTVNAYLAFRAGLLAFIKFNEEHSLELKSLLCPGLGTCTGRISPMVCAKQMRSAYDSVFGAKVFPRSLWAAKSEHFWLIEN
jgi:O-acetyl-ADP-ribose deacetylase (regulator of RNase III)